MANFEQTVILVFPLLTLNNWMLAGCFHQSTTYLKSTSTAFVWHIMEQKYGAFNVNFELSPYHNPSVIRQKGESQNRDKKKSEYAKFSEKQTFLTPWYAHVRHVRFSENLACFALLSPFWDSSFCLITNELILFIEHPRYRPILYKTYDLQFYQNNFTKNRHHNRDYSVDLQLIFYLRKATVNTCERTLALKIALIFTIMWSMLTASLLPSFIASLNCGQTGLMKYAVSVAASAQYLCSKPLMVLKKNILSFQIPVFF